MSEELEGKRPLWLSYAAALPSSCFQGRRRTRMESRIFRVVLQGNMTATPARDIRHTEYGPDDTQVYATGALSLKMRQTTKWAALTALVTPICYGIPSYRWNGIARLASAEKLRASHYRTNRHEGGT